ncbi:MAG: hypothetical protein J6P75_07940 [Bacteroidales bacterium]|nr:hypothetical protein [Bacteroidales bacterium]
MKHLFTMLASLSALLSMVSCSKDSISPEELFQNSDKVAKTSIHTRSDEYEDTETTFQSIAVYRNSDKEGQSWFVASSGGKMVYDAFMMSIYFDSIDNMKVGDVLNPSRFMFSFIFSSDSEATTHTYKGKITLADKGSDYVILRFNKVRMSCSFGDYVTDGYLYCPLFEEF